MLQFTTSNDLSYTWINILQAVEWIHIKHNKDVEEFRRQSKSDFGISPKVRIHIKRLVSFHVLPGH